MKINDWPEGERPRERLLTQGAKNLSNAELMAILFGFGCEGRSALDLARGLLLELGSLAKLRGASPGLIQKTKGLGKAKYASLMAALELGQRCLEESVMLGEKVGNSLAGQRLINLKLRGRPQEVFACLFLNNQNYILAFEELFQGSIRETTIYPREIIKRAMAHNAAKVILAHNHPSGLAQPSQGDKDCTQKLKEALSLVDIQVIDHIIVGEKDNFSFVAAGLL